MKSKSKTNLFQSINIEALFFSYSVKVSPLVIGILVWLSIIALIIVLLNLHPAFFKYTAFLACCFGAKRLYRRPAKRTLVVPTLDPALKAFRVKVMSRVTPQLGDDVAGLIVSQAYDAICFMMELIRIILSSA